MDFTNAFYLGFLSGAELSILMAAYAARYAALTPTPTYKFNVGDRVYLTISPIDTGTIYERFPDRTYTVIFDIGVSSRVPEAALTLYTAPPGPSLLDQYLAEITASTNIGQLDFIRELFEADYLAGNLTAADYQTLINAYNLRYAALSAPPVIYRYEIGDRVSYPLHGNGTVVGRYPAGTDGIGVNQYDVLFDIDGHTHRVTEGRLSPA